MRVLFDQSKKHKLSSQATFQIIHCIIVNIIKQHLRNLFIQINIFFEIKNRIFVIKNMLEYKINLEYLEVNRRL